MYIYTYAYICIHIYSCTCVLHFYPEHVCSNLAYMSDMTHDKFLPYKSVMSHVADKGGEE